SAAIQQCLFQLLHEQALAADLGQRHIENLVALGGHAQQLNLQPGMELLQTRLDMFGLPQGQSALTGGNRNLAGAHENTAIAKVYETSSKDTDIPVKNLDLGLETRKLLLLEYFLHLGQHPSAHRHLQLHTTQRSEARR